MINIAVNTRLAVVGEKERITTGSAGIEVQFTFSEDWDGLSKVALFRNGDEAETQVDMALDETGLTTLPPEICSEDYIDEAVMVGVYGTDGLGTVIIPTVWVSIGALREGAISQGSTAAPPTPDMWAQLQLLALNTGAENAEAAAASAEEAGEAEAAAKTAAGHYPQIVEGYWHVWDAEAGEYVNTEVKAEGVDGQDGQDGEGVPAGGTTGQFLQKASDDDHDTRWTTLGEASVAAPGLMSAADKTKLTGIEAGAQANTVGSVNGKTGAVVLNAGDLAYDDTETYGSGTVGAELSDLTRHLSDLDFDMYGENINYNVIGANALSQSGFNVSGLEQEVFVESRIRCNGYYPVNPGDVCTFNLEYNGIDPYFSIQFYAVADFATSSISTGSWVHYSEINTFTVPNGAYFVRFSFKNGSAGTSAISPSNFSLVELTTPAKKYTIEINQQFVFVNKGYDALGAVDNTEYNKQRLLNNACLPVTPSSNMQISAVEGLEYSVSFFESSDIAASRYSFINWTSSVDAIVPANTPYYRVMVRKSNNSTIRSGEVEKIYITTSIDGVMARLSALEHPQQDGIVIGTDFLTKKVRTEYVGTLKYLQSFCAYNSKYYSTDGSNIGVQNADFTDVSTQALPVGHGNAFQLGSGSVAYISGWDDQKIYAVDLSNLTISDTITLNTTGYTTAVVDDLNNIAYIFQRDSNPNSITHYNFIVYDLTNAQVISTKVINAFSAMQAADYYDGKIAILWGGGTSALPSGMAVYNTAGDILCRYDLDIFASTEPEGIFIERDSGSILVSDVNKNVYRITDTHS